MTSSLEKFDSQLRTAISKYTDANVDIVIEDDVVYGIYHSNSNSFNVTDTYTLSDIGGIERLRTYSTEFEDLCICEN